VIGWPFTAPGKVISNRGVARDGDCAWPVVEPARLRSVARVTMYTVRIGRRSGKMAMRDSSLG
jgi:hypothetical protein